MADNPITVPLPQDLPQNWTHGQSEVLALAKRIGAEDSNELQSRAPTMDGTALIAEEAKIISFEAAKRNANMLTRTRGFVCTYPRPGVILVKPSEQRDNNGGGSPYAT